MLQLGFSVAAAEQAFHTKYELNGICLLAELGFSQNTTAPSWFI